MDVPPVKYTPKSFKEIERMRSGLSPKGREHGPDAIEAHHRQQKSVENSQGVFDELTTRTHRMDGNHSRHDKPSELTDPQRKSEIRAHYERRGMEYKLPNDDY